MKYDTAVTSSRRKNRKAHFASDSSSRRKLMSAKASKEIRDRHGIRSMPLRKGDEVKVVRGKHKSRAGKIVSVYRKKFIIHIERVTLDKANGQPVPIPIQPSNVIITKLNLEKEIAKDRKDLIRRKAVGRGKAVAEDEDEGMPGLAGID